jgi:hypothetical protein
MISDIRVKGHGQMDEVFSSKQSNMFVFPSRFDNFRDLTVISTIPKQKVIEHIHLFLHIITGRCMEDYCNSSPSNYTIHIMNMENFNHSLADVYC